MLFALIYYLLTIGADPEVSVTFKHILLQDVINMEFVFVTYNDLVNHLMFIYYLCLITAVFLFYPMIAFVIGIFVIVQTVVTFVKFKLWKSNSKDSFIVNLLLMIFIFVLMAIFVILLLTATHIMSVFIMGIFSGVAGALCAFLIRFNMKDKQQRAFLSITSRRGKFCFALKPDDVREAKQLIWKTKNDSNMAAVATNKYESGTFTQ